jgi:nitric oxide reductase subunit C
MKTKTAIFTFSILCIAFAAFSCSIYIQPLFQSTAASEVVSLAAKGRLVWQRNNCQTCHQLYGLGGYLGPDLTNITSAPAKGDVFVLAMMRSGNETMPAYHLSEEEEQQLIAFLKSVDQTGKSNPLQFDVLPSGQIKQKQ